MYIFAITLQDSFGIICRIKTCRIQRLLEHTRLLLPHPPLQHPHQVVDLHVVPLQTLQQRQDGKGTLELIVTQILTKGRRVCGMCFKTDEGV